MPRLGLTATVVATKISSFLQKELSYGAINEFFWTNSNGANELIKSNRWWNGPNFFWKPLLDDPNFDPQLSPDDPEVKKVTALTTKSIESHRVACGRDRLGQCEVC